MNTEELVKDEKAVDDDSAATVSELRIELVVASELETVCEDEKKVELDSTAGLEVVVTALADDGETATLEVGETTTLEDSETGEADAWSAPVVVVTEAAELAAGD